MSSYYESPEALFSLLIHHYGIPDQIYLIAHTQAFRFDESCVFTVQESLREMELPRLSRALELGCAVGRSTFELRRYFDEVIGIDYSQVLIETALQMKLERACSATWQPIGYAPRTCFVSLPAHLPVDHVVFQQEDACQLPKYIGSFDLVFMDKLLDRLYDPEKCLAQMSNLVKTGGYLVIASPYQWREEFTPAAKWLGTPVKALARLVEILTPDFVLQRQFNVPYLLNTEFTWFSWGVSEASVWRRL
jgi:putative 4-mercaptohistidine N1-methyltranferase